MKIREKIENRKQKRVKDSLNKLISNPDSKDVDISRAFKKVNNKINFIIETFDYFSNPIPKVIQEAIIDSFISKPDSIDSRVFSILYEEYQKKLQEQLYNKIIDEQLRPSAQMFREIDFNHCCLDKKINILDKMNSEQNVDILRALLSKRELKTLTKRQIIQESMTQNSDEPAIKRIVNTVLKNYTLIDDENWIEIFNELAQRDSEASKKLIKQIIPEENQKKFIEEVIEIQKEEYCRKRLPDNVIQKMDLLTRDNAFKKYRIFRSTNFPNKQHVIPELLDSIDEFIKDRSIITILFNSDEQINEKDKLVLMEYIEDRKTNQVETIETIEDLKKYPEIILSRQEKQIESGRIACRESIVKNITGFSSVSFENLQQMFLNGHDIEELMKKNNVDMDTYEIISELVEFVDCLNDGQIKEFAQNIAKRNYNEISTKESILMKNRNNFKTTFSNIVSEYGKEFNSELGYNVEKNENDEVKTIYGPFTIYISQKNISRNIDLEDSKAIKHICVSLISEGHYGRLEEINNDVTYIYDYLPEQLMMLSSDRDMDSIRGLGKYDIPDEELEKRANFRTAQNTILSAKKTENGYNHTEQIYHTSGLDEDGNFIQIRPKAIGIWTDEQLTEELVKKAEEMGLEIVRIPDMQQNLSYMLKNGQVTPSLVKGIEGNYETVLTILEEKEKLENEDFLSIKILQEKIDKSELLLRVEKLLQRKRITFNEITQKVESITLKDLNTISKETRAFYELINNPEIERGE